jgi:hypothetical protein
MLCTMEIFTINTKDLLDSISVKVSLGLYAAIFAGRMEEFHVSTSSRSTLWALLFMVSYMTTEQFLNQSSCLLYGSNLTGCIAVSVTIYSFKIIPSIWAFCECSFLNHTYNALLITSYLPIFNVYCSTEMFTASHKLSDFFDIMAFIVEGDGAQFFCSGHRR